MRGRIFSEVRFGESEKCVSRFQAVLLEMNEGAGELNQAFVKITVRTFAIGKPEFLEDVVGVVIELLVEEQEVAEIVRVEFFPAAALDQGGNFRALFAHTDMVGMEGKSLKST